MKAKVLKPFKYAHDHITVVDLAVGDEPEIAEGVFSGLEGEGFIASHDDVSIRLIPGPIGDPVVIEEVPPVEGGANTDAHVDDFHIHHTGRGRWAVFDGQKRLTDEPLTKAEAEAKLAEFKAQA